MFISKSLARKLRHSASVLLHDGTDENGMPKVAVRQVKSAWGKFEPTGRKGGVCVTALSDGATHISYAYILGYHTGKEACIQPLILKDNLWQSKCRTMTGRAFSGTRQNCYLPPEQMPPPVSQHQNSQPRTIGSATNGTETVSLSSACGTRRKPPESKSE